MNPERASQALLRAGLVLCPTLPPPVAQFPRHQSDTPQTNDKGATNGSDS